MAELSLSPVEAVSLGAKVLAYGAALAAVGALSFIDTFRAQLAGPEIAGVKRHLLLLLCFAAPNKWRLVPALAAGAPDAGRRLQRSIAAEAGLVVLILVATGLLTSAFSPA